MANLVMKLLIVKIFVFSGAGAVDSRYTWIPKESAILSAMAITSKAPIMLALGLFASS